MSDDAANSESERVIGRPFEPGKSGNPSGRPKAFREYQDWLAEFALGPAKEALLRCLHNEDGKVQMMAVKEVADRLFGKAPQTILGEDGKPLLAGLGTELVAALAKMAGGEK
jgi:hypothetical protein